jgi:hypothetical protein
VAECWIGVVLSVRIYRLFVFDLDFWRREHTLGRSQGRQGPTGIALGEWPFGAVDLNKLQPNEIKTYTKYEAMAASFGKSSEDVVRH